MSNNQPPITIRSVTDLGNASLPTAISNNATNSYTTSVANSFNNLVNVLLPAVQLPGSTGQNGATGSSSSNILQVHDTVITENFTDTVGATAYRTIIDSSNVYVGWVGNTIPTSTNYGPTGYVGNLNVYSINGIPVSDLGSSSSGGRDGPAGETGPTGPAGDGIAGVTGAMGAQGATGAQGASPPGATGAVGPTGATNSTLNIASNDEDTFYYPTFVSGTGNQSMRITMGGSTLRYNPSTHTLTTGIFSASSTSIQPTPTLFLRNSNLSSGFSVVPYTGWGSYNGTTIFGDLLIVKYPGFETPMNIICDSAISNGLRVSANRIDIGIGGTGAVPSNSLSVLPTGHTFTGANLTINTIASLRSISEQIVGPTGAASTPYVCDYNTGPLFYLPPSVSSSTFSVRFINVPSITSTTQNYVLTIMYVAVSATNYCNTVTLSTTSTPSGSAATLKYNGTTAPAIALGNHIIQNFALTYFGASTVVLTTINVYS